jgi:serine protease Do
MPQLLFASSTGQMSSANPKSPGGTSSTSPTIPRSPESIFLLPLLLLLFLSQPSTPATPELRRDETVRAVEKVLPSVVNISSKTVVQRRGFFFNWWRDYWSPFAEEMPPQFSVGSGVIIDEEGYILTNVHVVEDATEIVVTLSDKRTYPAELIIGTRKSDVALLKIRGKPGEKFIPIKFAADDDLYLGETVIALGNPFGLGGSVSKGILSSKTRRTNAKDQILDVEDWIQTDAAINPGNSGGPLVNLDAELIGLNVAIYKEGQGIGFAIPVKRISESLSEIFTPEALRSYWFGAQFKSTTNGISTISVETGSPADKAGLRPTDIIVKINNVVPKSVFSANREIIASSERQSVAFQILRGREYKALTVRLVPEKLHFNSEMIRQKLGISVRELTPQAAGSLGLIMNGGLVVTAIEEGSPADNAGFQQGLIIESIDGQIPDSLVSAAKLLGSKKRGQNVRLTVILTNPLRRAAVDLKAR